MPKTLYHCPDCHHVHDDPADATYTLVVACSNCALERELETLSLRHPSRPDLVRAA